MKNLFQHRHSVLA